MQTQSLSFDLRIVRTRQDLLAACEVRAAAYGRHLPHLRSVLLEPDLLDADKNTTVVLCVDKVSGEAIATARFQTNAAGPLLIEHSVRLPAAMQTDTRVEITRLSVVPSADPLAKLCLMKASYLFCMASQIRWMVISARSEALIRQYQRLGFVDLFAGQPSVPMLHVMQIEHRVLAFNVTTAESRWRENGHALYQFMIETAHPDLQLFSTAPAMPRSASVDRETAGLGLPHSAAPRRASVPALRPAPCGGLSLLN
ncbi:hypothetical protein [Methylibium sp.]|uniref:hypothetical protein n=1 Tax=Methylibium sp. TaxID=2067992 RepID=UPI001854F543|nr:hypothetical protein [Methylibium sp.]MBA3590026.1 hypothetical protein [Methylibium sp.]